MTTDLFDHFAELIAGLPDAALIKALDLQYKLLQDEFRQTIEPNKDAYSVFCFIVYVRAAKYGKAIGVTVALPVDHIEFYKQTVARLVQAHELPSDAMAYFDKTLVVE